MKKILALLASIAPALLVAANGDPIDSTFRTVEGTLQRIVELASRILPILILAALVLFLFGIVKRFFLGGKEGADRAEAGKYILYGIVALFVMVSVWGLVNVLKGTFNLDTNNIPAAPAIPYQKSFEAQPGTQR